MLKIWIQFLRSISSPWPPVEIPARQTFSQTVLSSGQIQRLVFTESLTDSDLILEPAVEGASVSVLA